MKELSEHYTLVESAEDFEAWKRNINGEPWVYHHGEPVKYPCIVRGIANSHSDSVSYYFLYEEDIQFMGEALRSV
jgi:hypothetical protein